MAPRGEPAALALGPGYLNTAPLGTPEPVDLITPWDEVSAFWIGLGYTGAGSEFGYQLKTSPVMVEEELDTVKNAPDGRTSSVTFDLAQLTATNLELASNGGTITTGNGVVIFEPPDLGSEVHAMIGWESEDHTERWIYRDAVMNGAMKITRKKGAANATIACVFELQKPATGQKIYRAILAAPLRA
jgi:hypothetical protein